MTSFPDNVDDTADDNVDDGIEAPAHADNEIDLGETETARPRKAVGFKTLFLGMIMAALGGAAGGAFLSQYLIPPAPKAVQTDLSSVNSALDALARNNKALKAQISKIENKPAPAPVNLSPLAARLDAVEQAQKAAAEQASTPAIDEKLIARLEALQEEGSPALDLSDITQRLTALENAEAAPIPEPLPDPETQQALQDLYERQAEIFEKLGEVTAKRAEQDLSAQPFAQASSTALPALPEASLLAAVKRMEASESWAKRTLNKHISVKKEDDPRALIAGIKRDLDKGDADGAASKFDRLPSQIRSAGQDWRDNIKP